MSNRIGVMNAGAIAQEGSPQDIYMHPKTPFVAQFIGSTNQVTGKLRDMEKDGYACLDTEVGEIRCGAAGTIPAGSSAVVVVRPEDMILHAEQPKTGTNVIEGKVANVMFLGEYLDCTIQVAQSMLRTHQPHSLELRRGDKVWVELPAGTCIAFGSDELRRPDEVERPSLS